MSTKAELVESNDKLTRRLERADALLIKARGIIDNYERAANNALAYIESLEARINSMQAESMGGIH